MVHKKITNQMINRMCYALEYYDKHRCFPFDKKKVTFTLSNEAVNKLSNVKNRSAFINELIMRPSRRPSNHSNY